MCKCPFNTEHSTVSYSLNIELLKLKLTVGKQLIAYVDPHLLQEESFLVRFEGCAELYINKSLGFLLVLHSSGRIIVLASPLAPMIYLATGSRLL